MSQRDPRLVSGKSEHHVARFTAAVLAAVVVLLVCTAFLYSTWPAAGACSVLFATSAVVLIAWACRRAAAVPFSYTLPLLTFLPLWGVIQLVIASTVYRFGTLLSVMLLSGGACGFWLAAESFQFPWLLRWFRHFLIIFGVAICVIAILQLFSAPTKIFWLFDSPYTPPPLPMGPFVNRDRFSAFVELLLPLVLVEIPRAGKRWALYAVAAAVMYSSVVAGASRAGLIGISVETVVFLSAWLKQGHFSRIPMRTAALVFLIAVGLSTAMGWDVVFQRFREADPYGGRRELLISSFRMWRERPWIGFGLGSWPSVYPRFATFDPGRFVNHAHNDWAEWACDGGLPFVLGWFLIACRTAVRALKSPEALGVTIVFLHSLVDFNFQNYPILILVAVLIAASETVSPEEAVSRQVKHGFPAYT